MGRSRKDSRHRITVDGVMYPDTINLKTHVHTRAVGCRPFVELEPTDHPLAVERREGMTRERAQEIAELVLHGQSRE